MKKTRRIGFCAKRVLGLLVAAVLLSWSVTTVGFAGLTQTGVVATAASDWSSGATSVISVDPVGGPRTVRNNILPTISDISVVAFGKYFYRIERFNADNVSKFDIAAPSVPIWQFSTKDKGETGSSNPHDLVFLNSQKAYLIRYGAKTAWIVNPSATKESQFKIGQLDLSAYGGDDGIPDMTAGVIADNKLFIILQRLEEYCPTQTAYVAVFDLHTDSEIDTGRGRNGLMGIPLPIRNPQTIQYLPEVDKIYIQGAGAFPGICSQDQEYTGGIVSLNPKTYATTMVLDDGNASNHPYGSISGMLVASPQKGYFVGYAKWGDNTLYRFNPASGAVAGAVPNFQHINISGMESGTYLDKNKMLWVCNQSDHEVDILNTVSNVIDERVPTQLNPLKVAYCNQNGIPAPQLGKTTHGYSIALHWNIASGASGYRLYIAGPYFEYVTSFDLGPLTELRADISIPTAFWAAVVPYDANGYGDVSNIVFVNTYY